MSTQDINAPSARPRIENALVTSGACWLPDGCRSISAAPIALLTSPVAMPCSDRAMKSAATPSAARNTAQPAALKRSPAIITGRRPRYSETDPKASRFISNTRT
jgi:hypothetical protein